MEHMEAFFFSAPPPDHMVEQQQRPRVSSAAAVNLRYNAAVSQRARCWTRAQTQTGCLQEPGDPDAEVHCGTASRDADSAKWAEPGPAYLAA